MDTALLPQIGLFGKTFVAQITVEHLTVELAGHPLEIVVVHNRFSDRLVTNGKSQPARLVIERRVGDEPGKNLPVKTILVRLFVGDVAVFEPLLALQFGLIDIAKCVGADLDPADLREIIRAESAKNVANTPDRKTEDDQAHQDRHDNTADPALRRGTH